jgi:aminoglycoside 6-adenylyltransferase
MLNFDFIIQRFAAWAEVMSDVRAALILGSRARKDHPADEWSDLDILLFAINPDQFIQKAEWAREIAPYWLTFVERSGDGRSWERRTLYEGGLDVDVVITPVEWLESFKKDIPADIADIIRRGVRILVDKDKKLTQLMQIQLPDAGIYQKPTEAEFINTVSDFWYHTVWCTKHLRRGELWWSKSGVDMYLKGHLQRMLEWHARAMHGEDFDTWLRGRFMEEWADVRAIQQLPEVFAHYDYQDVARALRATMSLYRWLEDETAASWGYACPTAGEQQTAALSIKLLE